MLKILKALYLFLNVTIIVALITIHFVIKDKNFDASLFFYVFPLPVIILIILLLSIFLGKNRRKYNIILAVFLLIIWLSRSFRINFSNDIKKSDTEIVFWNASRDNGFETAIKEHGGMPDIMVLTESDEKDFNSLKIKYPNYFFYQSNEEIQVFSKTPIEILDEETSRYNSTVIHFKTDGIQFYAVDVTGSTDVPRAWELKFVNSIIKKSQNVVVLGDFNVPYESIFLKEIKANYIHFFSKKGNGFRETWFWNIPLLSLDHIWISDDLKIISSKKINTENSDHSMIKTVIRKQIIPKSQSTVSLHSRIHLLQ